MSFRDFLEGSLNEVEYKKYIIIPVHDLEYSKQSLKRSGIESKIIPNQPNELGIEMKDKSKLKKWLINDDVYEKEEIEEILKDTFKMRL